MKIEDIRRPKGAGKAHRRVGRGSGSGHGKTSGRGHKGAKSRSGATHRFGFEGGQMTLIRRTPKRGFTNAAKVSYQVVNVDSLNSFRKDSVIDKEVLKQAGLVKKLNQPVKILGSGKITKPLSVSVEAFSESARKKISEAGGEAKVKIG